MPSLPLSPLTIVIPVFNREKTLQRTLDSIDRQTVAPAAVIIVDNGSTDASLGIATAWAQSRRGVTVLTEAKSGACAARNRGLEAVTTEWTMFFDSDDEMLPSHIEDFTRAIARNPHAGIIGRDIIMNELGGNVRRLYFKAGSDALFHHLFRGCLSTQRYVARTSLFRKAGGWNETLAGWNDYELGVRLLLTDPSIVAIKGAPTVVCHSQADSITGTSFTAHPERWERSLEAVRGHFESVSDDSRRNRLLFLHDARCMILAAAYEREARASSSAAESEKSRRLSRSMYERVMSRTSAKRAVELVYRHNLRFGRLTWMLARALAYSL